MWWFIVALVAGLVSIVTALAFSWRVLKAPPGSAEIQKVSSYIRQGARGFLLKEYSVLAPVILVIAALLWLFLDNKATPVNEGFVLAVSLVVGAVSSLLAGWLGMMIATAANGRVTNAALKGLNPAFRLAFAGGSVMGFFAVGIGLVSLSILGLIFQDPNLIFGFSLGASTIALFARVGGGIYTKAADVGADLVGKVEAGIPEDDPRNPGTIADNVGDNVGDVAGMGADLFESYVGSILAALVLGTVAFGTPGLAFPLLIASGGVGASLLASFLARGSTEKQLTMGLRVADIGAAVLVAVFAAFASQKLFGTLNPFWAMLSGLVGGILIGLVTEYFTSHEFKPARKIAEDSVTGAGTNVISGLGVGMLSAFFPATIVAVAIAVSFDLSGLYGVAIAGVGMLSILAISLSTDAYGPISDNAGGIAEMTHQPKQVRQKTDVLDAIGNTTAAIGKGFAIGSAALTALALFAAFATAAGIASFDLLSAEVFAGLLVGAGLPLLFSSFAMRAVSNGANKVVQEVRRQFKVYGVLKGKGEPNYAECVRIVTGFAITGMILPATIALLAPIIMGFISIQALGGMLAGAISSGFLMAVLFSNAGGAWDNAKKYIEKGKLGGKGSNTHKAAVIGDTVGDPLKDTAGPSLNILLKLMSVVALILVPLIV